MSGAGGSIGKFRHVPSDLLDDVPNERSALAEVALHARDTRLRLARGDFLYGEISC